MIALYFVIVGACIGAAIGAVSGVRDGQWRRARQGGLVGAVLGLAGGAVGSLPGEFAFEALNGLGLGLIGRAAGWALVGIFIGVVQGAIARDPVRMARGGLGGLIGGYLGGGAFEIVSQLSSGGAGSRWIAVVLLGLFLGALITIFERWLSSARLTVISSGPQEGNRYEISKKFSVLGKGDRDDFMLYAGEGIYPGHAGVEEKADGCWIRPLQPGSSVYVNRQLIQGEQRLRNGSEVGIGSIILRYSEDIMRCPYCDTENASRAGFCRGCGQTLPKSG